MECSKNFSIENIENEIWRDIIGYEGFYMISNKGRVKGLKRKISKNGILALHKEKIRKQGMCGSGYWNVSLCRDGIVKNKMVHRLVGIAFIPNPENKREINHKNNIKTDNDVNNLEWATPRENQLHAITHGKTHCHTTGINNVRAKFTDEKIREFRGFYESNKNLISIRKMAKIYKVNNMTLHCIIKRKTWKHII